MIFLCLCPKSISLLERSIHACESSKATACRLPATASLGSPTCSTLCQRMPIRRSIWQNCLRGSPAKNTLLCALPCRRLWRSTLISTRQHGSLQHPSTIRYRISRLKEHLGVKSELEFQILAILLTVSQSDHSENATGAHTEESAARGTARTRH